MIGFLWGLGILAVIGIAFMAYRWELRAKARTGVVPTPNQIAIQVEAAVASGLQNLPRMVSDEVQRLEAEGAAALARAEKAETALVAANQAHAASLAAVAARVAAAVTSSPELPPSPVAPAVAAAQAEDVAAVQALANELTPA